MRTKKAFLELLDAYEVRVKHQPILFQEGDEKRESLCVRLSTLPDALPYLAKPYKVVGVNKNIAGWERRVTAHRVKYNRWLYEWYLKHSSGPLLCERNEFYAKMWSKVWLDERIEQAWEQMHATEVVA